MRLLEYFIAKRQQIVTSRWQPVPPAPGNPMQMKEPYDMFYRSKGAYTGVAEVVSPTERKEPFTFFQRIPVVSRLIGPLVRKQTPSLVGPYVPGWHRTSNFGTVERHGKLLPQKGVIPSAGCPACGEPYNFFYRKPQPEIVSPIEHKEPFSFFQRTPPQDIAAPKAWPRTEPQYDFSYATRGQIGAPKHGNLMPSSSKETYDFTY